VLPSSAVSPSDVLRITQSVKGSPRLSKKGARLGYEVNISGSMLECSYISRDVPASQSWLA
jgi:hypothetical protein